MVWMANNGNKQSLKTHSITTYAVTSLFEEHGNLLTQKHKESLLVRLMSLFKHRQIVYFVQVGVVLV
jgi:hypothetical protein